MPTLKVTLNCTSENRYLKLYEVGQNPFPQILRAELMPAMNQLNSLAGDPLTSLKDIKERLPGWSKEFVELCMKNFKPGEWVIFRVYYPEEIHGR